MKNWLPPLSLLDGRRAAATTPRVNGVSETPP